MTKYGFEFSKDIIDNNINRLTNQIWKILPMKENNENYLDQLDTVIIEIAGLNTIFNLDEHYLVLLSKLEGLRLENIEFLIFRKTIFESITLLRGLKHV